VKLNLTQQWVCEITGSVHQRAKSCKREETSQSTVKGAERGVEVQLRSRSDEQRAVTGAQKSNEGIRELMASMKHEREGFSECNTMM